MSAVDEVVDWHRLDRRMLLVHPVREVVRFLPVLIGLLLFGRGSDGGPWALVGVAIPVGLGLLRYVTTSYRLTAGRIEVRNGLLNKQVVSTPLDRVRTVDLTASPIHRALGLVTVRVGTGESRDKGDGKLSLDGLSVPAAERLRARLLHVGLPKPARSRRPTGHDESSSPSIPAGCASPRSRRPASSSPAPHSASWPRACAPSSGHRPSTSSSSRRLGVTVLALGGLAVVLVVLCLLAVVGYVVTNFGFVLSHTAVDGAWHLRRGLFTTRETSLDDARVSGVSIGEPLSLRLAGGARLSAIVTGLGRKQQGSSVLVPPAPRAEVDRVAVAVLGGDGPVTSPLVPHGPRAVRRRWTRALVPASAIAAASTAAAYYLTPWLEVVAVAALLVGVALAADRVRTLGHTVVDGHLVARSGSLTCRREALATPSVIGWNLQATWFQRRAGLTDLVATTAGGRQFVRVVDVPADDALAIARTAQARLLDQFLA